MVSVNGVPAELERYEPRSRRRGWCPRGVYYDKGPASATVHDVSMKRGTQARNRSEAQGLL